MGCACRRCQAPPEFDLSRGIADILKRLRASERPKFDAEALVTTAYRRLRLRRMLVAIEQNPRLLEEDMATPFLQGLTKAIDMMEHDLEEDAKALTLKIGSVKQRGKAAISKGHLKVDATASRVGDVEKFVTALEGANGGGPLDGSQDSSGKSPKPPEDPPKTETQQTETDTQVIAGSEVGKVEEVIKSEPESSWSGT